MKSCSCLVYTSPLGEIRIAVRDGKLVAVALEGQQDDLPYRECFLSPEDQATLDLACQWLDLYFGGSQSAPDHLPLDPQGTEFQKRVWAIIRKIPWGEMLTYRHIAEALNPGARPRKLLFRAVGQATGANPLAIVIPCHRVIGAGGNLTGYAGGIGLKVRLLEIEGFDLSRFHWPDAH